jgi:hypothetical protein
MSSSPGFDAGSLATNTGASSSSLSITIKTGMPSELIIIDININNGATAAPVVNTPTATGLTFTNTYNQTATLNSNNCRMARYTAPVTSASSNTVTVTLGASAVQWNIIGYAFADVNATPFDSGANASLTNNAAGGSSTTPTITGFTTTAALETLLWQFQTASGNASTAPVNFIQISNIAQTTYNSGSFYIQEPTIISAQTFNGQLNRNSWFIVLDALAPGSDTLLPGMCL